MEQLILTKKLYEYIETECNKHNEDTCNFVEPHDVLYSLLYSDDETFRLLNDWDEGEPNDPFWNKENNMHSAEYFIKQMCKIIKETFQI
jgi:hypothetical protein